MAVPGLLVAVGIVWDERSLVKVLLPSGGQTLFCFAKGCCCGQPIVIRTIAGRRVPIHIRG